ncbi:MAG: SxtJ family membrane protein [Pyrinomonadaceae bacterium]
MPFVKLNWKPNKKELRQFGAIFMGGFVLIGLVKYLWPFQRLISQNETVGLWFIAIGLVVGAIGLTGRRLALPLYWTWLGIAYVLGNIMSRVIMAGIYYLVFTPMRLIGNLMGRDKLQLKKPQTDSYWVDISFPTTKEEYERQF